MQTQRPINPSASPGAHVAGPARPRSTPASLSIQRVRKAIYAAFAGMALLVVVLAVCLTIAGSGPAPDRELLARAQAQSPAAADTARLAELLSQAQARARLGQGVAIGGAVLMLVCLALLAWAVVEPTVDFVRKQHRRVARRAAHLGQLAQVARHTGSMVILSDRADRTVWVNGAFTAMSGWKLEEVRGRFPGEVLYSPHADPQAMARLSAAVERGEGVHLEARHRTRDGRDLWLDIDMQPLHDSAGHVTGFVSVNTDITAQMGERAKTRTLLATLPTGVVVQAADGRITEANSAAQALLGLTREHLGHRASRLSVLALLRDDGSEYPNHELPPMQTLRSGRPVRAVTLGLRQSDGEIRWMLVEAAPLQDAFGAPAGVASCWVDITEQRRLEQRLSDDAQIDALTQLPNRSVALERVRRTLEHAGRNPGYGFAVLFMDFDRFRQVNDTLGHAAGDELLRQVSQRLLETLRPGDAVARVDLRAQACTEAPPQTAARFAGDEFVVVLEGVGDADQVRTVCERLLQELARPYTVFNHPVQSSVSMGVVTAEHAAASAEEVLRDADTAMSEAKRSGRGRVVMFEGSMHERLVRHLAIENELRRALREHELFVVYQPVVGLADGKMIGVEAFVRWLHPQRGLVPPVEFMPVAEDSGLVADLGEFVLVQACGQFIRWRAALGVRAPRQLAVNLSRAQLGQPGLVESVRRVLQGCGMAPSELQLEVAESCAAQDAHSLATLQGLKALGVGLALDDFGSGNSSLSCLHELPVDTVKIDHTFVTQAGASEYHRVLVKSIIGMCRTLGIATVAEGIETVQQSVLMAQLGCDRGQGFLYGRPLRAEELHHWSAGVR